MKRYAAMAPLALLPGCAHARDGTPAGWLERSAEQVPPYEHTLVPPVQVAVARWQLPADNPWAAYSKLTLLSWVGPTEADLELPAVSQLVSASTAECAAAQLARGGLPPDTLWLVDLRGADSVAFAESLSRWAPQRIAPVLTFNNWPDAHELIPADETLAALLAARPRLPDPGEPGIPVFLLDSWRLAFTDQQILPDAFDNRYVLSAADFPDVPTLEAHGIHRVVYVVEDLSRVPLEEDDVHPVLLGYQQAGLEVAKIDLAELCHPPRPISSFAQGPWDSWYWQTWWGRYRCRIEHRSVQTSIRALYASSPGGFGGVHAEPVHWSGGGHGGGFGGG